MLKVVVVLVAVAVLSGTATAASGVPAGFKANARLSKPATWIAGHRVTAYCAPTQAAMNALVSPTATNVAGATPVIGGSVINLAPLTCAYLDAWLNGKKVNLYNFAVAIETLAHESELAKGIADETTATCRGIPQIPGLVARFFPLEKRESLHDLMGDVHDVWTAQSAVYHAHAC